MILTKTAEDILRTLVPKEYHRKTIEYAAKIAVFNKPIVIEAAYICEAAQYAKETPKKIIAMGAQSPLSKQTGTNALEARLKEIGII